MYRFTAQSVILVLCGLIPSLLFGESGWVVAGAVNFRPVADEIVTGAEPGNDDPTDSVGSTTTAMPEIRGEGWVELFNGKDLTGWVQRNGTATYRVEDAMIIGKTTEGSPNSFLCTEKEFTDFELTFEVNGDPGLNSGVQIRSRSTPDYNNGRVHGPQVEIENSPGESGYLYSEGTARGWITEEQPIKDAYRNGQWNRYVIRVQGDRIQSWVNGRAIADIRDPESVHSGFIGLQVHGIPRESGPFQVRWRDIRIRQL